MDTTSDGGGGAGTPVLSPGRPEPPAGADTMPGRNQNWVTGTGPGPRLFVKRFTGQADSARLRMRRSLAFERLRESRMAAISPRVVLRDEQNLLIGFEFVTGADTGADLISGSDRGADLAFRAGRVIGSVHALNAGEAVGSLLPDDGPPALPSAELLRGLPFALFRNCSAGELKAWRLMQEDGLLTAAVDSLLAQSARAPRVLAHCDLRLDQFLVSGDRLYVIDWEEFRMADAARDVGSLAGEWVYQAVTGWAGPGSEPLADEDVMAHCTSGIDAARPAVAALWSGYRDASRSGDPGLAARSAAFAGWHMYDRMLAAARHSVRLSAVARAAAGIGRAMMADPAQAAAAIGLGGA